MKLIRQSEVYLMEEAVTEQIIQQAASDFNAGLPASQDGTQSNLGAQGAIQQISAKENVPQNTN